MQFIVLKTCRTLLKISNLSDEKCIRFKKYNIPAWLFTLICLFTQNFKVILCLWYFFDYDFAFDKIIWPVNVCMTTIQMEAIYVCLIFNKKLLSEILNQFQNIIDQSK